MIKDLALEQVVGDHHALGTSITLQIFGTQNRDLLQKSFDLIDHYEDIFFRTEADEAAKIDEAVKKRLSLIDTAKSVIPDFKYDGLTDRDIMLKVIEKTLPYEQGVKVDELDEVFIIARFDAALSLAKEKANITGETLTSGRIDEAEIEKKKNKRLNMMEE